MEIGLAQFQMDDGAAGALQLARPGENGQRPFAFELPDAGSEARHDHLAPVGGGLNNRMHPCEIFMSIG